MKDKIIRLFQTGSKENIDLGYQLAESQGVDLSDFIEELQYIKNESFSFENLFFGSSKEIMDILTWDEIYISDQPLTTIPSGIEYFQSLKNLSLEHNKIRYIPRFIFEMNSITSIHLAHNEIKRIPSGIKKLSNLKYLNLHGNPISRNHIQELIQWLPKCEIRHDYE